jgi:hypothetical protein
MMKDFDEHMQQEGGAFKLQPRKEVWERIEAELDAKKKRRRVLWYWWILPLTLAAGLGGNALLQDKNEINKKEFSKPTHEGNTAHTTPDAVLETNVEQSNNAFEPKSTEPAALPTGSVAFRTPSVEAPIIASTQKGTKQPFSSILPETEQLEASHTKENEPSSDFVKMITDSAENNVAKAGNLKDSKAEEKNNEISSLALAEHKTKYDADSIKMEGPLNTMAPTEKENVSKSIEKKNVQWRMVAGGGMHKYTSQTGAGTLFGSRMEMADQFFSPTNPGSNIVSVSPPKPGAGFMLGIERSQILEKHPRWEWQAGLHYQYQTVQISTGARRDSAILLENIGAGFSNNRSDFYYVPGDINTQTGTQHRIHLQTGVGWHLHKNRKWVLQGLFFGGMVFHADYLVPHSAQTGFIPVDKVLQKGYWGMETGLRYQPGKMALGIYGQTNLSSSISNTSLPKQYWQGAELRIHYQLTNIK